MTRNQSEGRKFSEHADSDTQPAGDLPKPEEKMVKLWGISMLFERARIFAGDGSGYGQTDHEAEEKNFEVGKTGELGEPAQPRCRWAAVQSQASAS